MGPSPCPRHTPRPCLRALGCGRLYGPTVPCLADWIQRCRRLRIEFKFTVSSPGQPHQRFSFAEVLQQASSLPTHLPTVDGLLPRWIRDSCCLHLPAIVFAKHKTDSFASSFPTPLPTVDGLLSRRKVDSCCSCVYISEDRCDRWLSGPSGDDKEIVGTPQRGSTGPQSAH